MALACMSFPAFPLPPHSSVHHQSSNSVPPSRETTQRRIHLGIEIWHHSARHVPGTCKSDWYRPLVKPSTSIQELPFPAIPDAVFSSRFCRWPDRPSHYEISTRAETTCAAPRDDSTFFSPLDRVGPMQQLSTRSFFPVGMNSRSLLDGRQAGEPGKRRRRKGGLPPFSMLNIPGLTIVGDSGKLTTNEWWQSRSRPIEFLTTLAPAPVNIERQTAAPGIH
ncbi:hypothetical protein B0H66DRAFT_82710 [Apodospora peruviana]|uniref:Uncharacterized protein n=1 Tax=Apodospora peruviana TaxID=516989 RepID=A0AAE0ITI2_9PEZI|nr:hypothetical protein B0H66DRAFT_82710 [Apodospora peruviana]